jgi:4-amino-4-deoxy-L-arabinose transferase-like glycosyltransferase
MSWRGFAVGAAAAFVALLGTAVRVSNAWLYPTNWGFDAKFNWEYIELLRSSWALPAPETLWATTHPPLFYYLAAGLNALLGYPEQELAVSMIRLLGTLAGLTTVGLAVLLVRRVAPGNAQRALMAAVLLLFLPAHIYMSAMLNEEILAASLISAAVFGLVWVYLSPARSSTELWRAAAIGLACGLAWLTKLTGVLAVFVAVVTYAAIGWRRKAWRAAGARILIVVGVAVVSGGWYYIRNWILYGYLYPFGMPVHELMFSMPPGSRSLFDYVYVPIATWTDPQLLSPDLLKSVWGSTYATLWYDGHRFFLPSTGPGQRLWGTRILLLALLPTAAFLVGTGRGAIRALRHYRVDDISLLTLICVTLAGYVLFTFRNPWFASVKGSYLLGLSVPFAVYGSEALDRWARGHWLRATVVWGCLILLVAAVTLVFSYGLIMRKAEVPGLVWTPEGQG